MAMEKAVTDTLITFIGSIGTDKHGPLQARFALKIDAYTPLPANAFVSIQMKMPLVNPLTR
jgi:hypothetical protein